MLIKTIKEFGPRSSTLSLGSRAYQRASRILLKSIPFIPSDHRYSVTVCDERQFMWFRVAKVGTRTILRILEAAHLTLDAEQAYSCHYPVKLYRRFFKFGFVRNPWDRLVSCWLDKVVKHNHFNLLPDQRERMLAFPEFVDYAATLNLDRCDEHLRLQSRLVDLNNIDYLGHFEDFERDLSEVLSKIGLGDVAISRQNASADRMEYKSYYDATLKSRVGNIYQRDVRLFGYSF